MWSAIQSVLKQIDDFVWGVPLMVLILSGGLLLTVRLGLLQVRKLGLALKWMVQNEEEGEGEISSFAALCTALSATIGTGNIVGVATAVCAGGPGALFWMIMAAFLGMATKYSEPNSKRSSTYCMECLRLWGRQRAGRYYPVCADCG